MVWLVATALVTGGCTGQGGPTVQAMAFLRDLGAEDVEAVAAYLRSLQR